MGGDGLCICTEYDYRLKGWHCAGVGAFCTCKVWESLYIIVRLGKGEIKGYKGHVGAWVSFEKMRIEGR